MLFIRKYSIRFFILLFFIGGTSDCCHADSLTISALKSAVKTAKEDTVKVNMLSQLAFKIYMQSQYDSSRKYLNQGILLAEKLNDTKGLAELLRTKGDIFFWDQKDYDQAIKEHEKSLELEKKNGKPDKVALCYDKIARTYMYVEQYSMAVLNFEEELKIYNQLQDTTGKIKVLLSIWEIYNSRLRDMEKAVKYYSEFTQLANSLIYNDARAKFYGDLGYIYFHSGNYEKASEYLDKALELYREIGDKSSTEKVLGMMGDLNGRIGNYKKAVEYYQQGLDIVLQLELPASSLAGVYNNAGWGYYNIGNYTRALDYELKAVELYAAEEDEYGLAYPLGNIGMIYYKLGDYNKAIEYSNQSADLYRKSGQPGGVAEAYCNIGNAYRAKNENSKSLEYLKKALAFGKQARAQEEIKNTHEGLADTYEMMGDYKNAYKNYKIFIHLKDSIINQENLERINTQYINNESERKQKELELVSKDVELKAAELKKQGIIAYSAIAGVGLLLLLTFFVYRNYLQKRNANEQLEESNAQILLQKKEVEKSHQNTKLLSNIGREITASLLVEEIIEKVYENVNTLMDASVFLIGIYDAKKNQLSVPGAMEKNVKLPFYVYDLEDKSRPAVWCFENQKEVFMNDFKKEYAIYFPGKEVPRPVSGDLPESLIYYPLTVLNKKIGVLSVQSFKRDAYTEYDLDIIRTLAIYVTTALENARLYENMEAEVKGRTAEIEKQKDELEKLSIVASETDNAVMIADAKGNIQWLNTGYTRLTGFSLEDYKGKNILELSGNPKIWEIVDDCIHKFKSAVYDVMNKTKDGREIWVQTTLTPVVGVDKKVKNLVLIDSDITELKLVETEIKKQNLIISEKNKHITDSINYAKRIQEATLPNNEIVSHLLSEAFVYYKPKDIVSGDFYWMTEKNNKLYFAVVDCTGHGVPGAFVSIIGHNGLYRSVNEFGLTKPSEILDKLNELVEETFGQNNKTQINDGMDIALCRYDKKSGELQFAGANNPLYFIVNGIFREIKGDKQPIGAFDHRRKFTNHSIKLKKDDTIYIFSDGYADQFGGPSKKKFKYDQFKNLILSVQNLTMSEQREVLYKTMNSWMGNLEQVDDMCVIGVKV